MKLYEMLSDTLYYQKICIFEINDYSQNMPLFKGIVDDARKDDDVWYYLMNKVEQYFCEGGVLVIKVKSKHYKKCFEKQYSGSDEWGKEISQRPWRWCSEIKNEIKKLEEGE